MTPPTRRTFPSPPTQARAVVLCAHPDSGSFSSALAQSWVDGALGIESDVVHLGLLEFNPVLGPNYGRDQALEPDLLALQAKLESAAHLVVAYPVWWSSTPALLKGLFDRLLLPGWAYATVDGRPKGGLTGRSARTLVTMDAPLWYDRLFNRGAARAQVSTGTLKFCGFSPVRETAFGGVGESSAPARQVMLAKARTAGKQDAERLLGRFPVAAKSLLVGA
ncbi:MAG: NAD(P)H dehydrogenase (quinone) [Cognaticolwellia sp.]|jgi:NAD(P)H dehydrogenase (quinone)